MTALELPEGADPAPRSAVTYPPCGCPLGTECPVTPAERATNAEHGQADEDSPTLMGLRARVQKDCKHRQEYGQLGRLL